MQNNFETLQEHDRITVAYLTLVLQSAFIPETHIISTMIITKAGAGKTMYLELLRQKDFVEYTIDITPKRIADFLGEVDNGKKKFLVLPDFVAHNGHSKATVELTESIFREMMQSGVPKISIYGMEREYRNNPKAGLITAVTNENANMNSGRWRRDGFYSRLLPWSYSYNNVTVQRILNNKWRKIKPFDLFKMEIIEKPDDVEITELTEKEIQIISKDIILPSDYPFRSYDLVTALCKSSAVLRDSNTVDVQDTDQVRRMSFYMNRKQNPI